MPLLIIMLAAFAIVAIFTKMQSCGGIIGDIGHIIEWLLKYVPMIIFLLLVALFIITYFFT